MHMHTCHAMKQSPSAEIQLAVGAPPLSCHWSPPPLIDGLAGSDLAGVTQPACSDPSPSLAPFGCGACHVSPFSAWLRNGPETLCACEPDSRPCPYTPVSKRFLRKLVFLSEGYIFEFKPLCGCLLFFSASERQDLKSCFGFV